jgi:hypothetical protein
MVERGGWLCEARVHDRTSFISPRSRLLRWPMRQAQRSCRVRFGALAAAEEELTERYKIRGGFRLTFGQQLDNGTHVRSAKSCLDGKSPQHCLTLQRLNEDRCARVGAQSAFSGFNFVCNCPERCIIRAIASRGIRLFRLPGPGNLNLLVSEIPTDLDR